MSLQRVQLRQTVSAAEGYLELGMTEHALHALQRRGKLVHANARACYLLGETLRELECYQDAIIPLQRSSELMPEDIHVWLALGWCYKRTGHLDSAIESLELALEVDSSEAILHYNLACYWSLARNRILALSYLSEAIDIDSNYRELIFEEPDFSPLHNDPAFKLIAGVIV